MYETGSAITASGALSAYSGAKTGRSPSDKRIVEEDSSKKDVWWGPVNKPMTPDVSAFVRYFFSCDAAARRQSRRKWWSSRGHQVRRWPTPATAHPRGVPRIPFHARRMTPAFLFWQFTTCLSSHLDLC